MGAGATQLEYGGVTIHNCQTVEFSEESVLDQSGTDQIYHHYRLSVIGYIHGGLPGYSASVKYLGIFPNPGNQDAAQHHRQIRAALMAPRQHLVYTLGSSGGAGGTVLVEARPFPNDGNFVAVDQKNRDVTNGPHPKSFNIVHIAGNNVLKVQYTIEFSLIHCGADDAGLGRRPAVLNNRWSCSDAIDGNMFTQRTWRGTLRLVTALVNAHQFRGHVVPRLAPGFRRESMDFEVAPDGLTLGYTIIDREVYAAAPKPATHWQVSHMETVTMQEPLTARGTVTVDLQGDRNADKGELLGLAVVIADQRLDFLKGNVNLPDKALILAATLIDDFGSSGENRIRFQIEVRHMKGVHEDKDGKVFKDNPAARNILNLQLSGWGVLPEKDSLVDGYDPDLSRGASEGDDIELEGPARAAGAFAAHLQSICNPAYSFEDALPVNNDLVAEESPAPPEITARVVDVVNSEIPDWASESHQEHLYVFWQFDTHYEVTENTVSLPYADSSAFNRESAGSPGPTAAIIHLSAPTARRVVRLKGERVGKTPEMPIVPTSFVDENGIRYTRRDTTDVSIAPVLAPGDVMVYTATAEYTFWMSRPPVSTDTLRTGWSPWNIVGLSTSPEADRIDTSF